MLLLLVFTIPVMLKVKWLLSVFFSSGQICLFLLWLKLSVLTFLNYVRLKNLWVKEQTKADCIQVTLMMIFFFYYITESTVNVGITSMWLTLVLQNPFVFNPSFIQTSYRRDGSYHHQVLLPVVLCVHVVRLHGRDPVFSLRLCLCEIDSWKGKGRWSWCLISASLRPSSGIRNEPSSRVLIGPGWSAKTRATVNSGGSYRD